MKQISSRDNPRYKELKKLAGSSTARARAGQTLLDGVHLCSAWLASGAEPDTCIVGQSALSDTEVALLLERVDSARVLVLDDALFAPLSQVEHGVALLFVVNVPQPVAPARINEPCLLLDRLQDPGNLGSILRSAAAAGIRQVLCSSGCVAAWSPKVLRAGMGAHFHLEIFEDCDLQDWLVRIAPPVYAMSSHATASLYGSDVRQASWLLGNEGQGVSAELLASGVSTLLIPQPGGLESLNVAAAAAVCLFEQVRQRALERA
jgi:TrmH family RNA methyltransferase